jgi:hypothetical protein
MIPAMRGNRRNRPGFVIIWGQQNQIKNLGPGPGQCRRCGGGIVVREIRRWFTFFFIPMWPVTPPRQFGQCFHCGEMYQSQGPVYRGPAVTGNGPQPVLAMGPDGSMPLGYQSSTRTPGEKTLKWWGWLLLAAAVLMLLIGLAGKAAMIAVVLLCAIAVTTILVTALGTSLTNQAKGVVCSIVTAFCWVFALVTLEICLIANQANRQIAAPGSPRRMQAKTNPGFNPPPMVAGNPFPTPANAPWQVSMNIPTPAPTPVPARTPAFFQPKATETVGGSAGGTYRRTVGPGKVVIGFKWSTQTGAPGAVDPNATVFRAIEPLAVTPPNMAAGPVQPNVQTGTSLARDGYAVGAIEVDADTVVHAIRVTFMRYRDGKLEPANQYMDGWIGTPTGNATRMLGGDGLRIVGIAGHRNERIYQSLGLLQLDPDPTGQ